MINYQELRKQIDEQGFCRIENFLKKDMVDDLYRLSNMETDQMSDEEREQQKSTGSMINSFDTPSLLDLITLPAALSILKDLGYKGTKFWSGYLISKPGPSPRLFWHQDGMSWTDPRSYAPCGSAAPMLFFMYYLVDTSPENGCLRVLPGTHLKRHALHESGEAHTDDVRRIADPSDPRFADQKGEMDVPVNAGDLVVGDARMFHASHANSTDQQRPVITLWYLPEFDTLIDPLRASFARSAHSHQAKWPQDTWQKLKPILCDYDGEAEPLTCRTADARLK